MEGLALRRARGGTISENAHEEAADFVCGSLGHRVATEMAGTRREVELEIHERFAELIPSEFGAPYRLLFLATSRQTP